VVSLFAQGAVGLLVASFRDFPWDALNGIEEVLGSQELHTLCLRLNGEDGAPFLSERFVDSMIVSWDFTPELERQLERHSVLPAR